MAVPLSQDLRRRLVDAVAQGSSARAAAARFEVSPAAAVRIVRQARETGSTASGRIGGYRKPLLGDREALLRELVEGRKGITLAEIRDELTAHGIRSGALSTIWTTLRRLGLSHKKALRGG